jgi:hypothetical protein
MKKMMNEYNDNMENVKYSKSIFENIKGPGFFLRVNELHPLELRIGIDLSGRKTIRLIGDYTKKPIKKTNNIFFQYFKTNDGQLALDLSLNNEDFLDIFYYFCDDLVRSSMEVSVSEGLDFIINRYEKWRVFSKNNLTHLSEMSIKGLIGELLFLKHAFTLYCSQSEAISAWTGTEPTKKDFTFNDYWYEIKVSSNQQVTISSFDQLESKYNGYLVVTRFEKLSPKGMGISLNKLVEDILSQISLQTDRDSFFIKLIDADYYKSDYYDDFIYQVIETNLYEINEKFPKIEKDKLDNRIVEVKYTIDLTGLKNIPLEDFQR